MAMSLYIELSRKIYTLHGHGCGNYSELIFIDSKGWNRRIAGYATVPATRLSVKISR